MNADEQKIRELKKQKINNHETGKKYRKTRKTGNRKNLTGI